MIEPPVMAFDIICFSFFSRSLLRRSFTAMLALSIFLSGFQFDFGHKSCECHQFVFLLIFALPICAWRSGFVSVCECVASIDACLM